MPSRRANRRSRYAPSATSNSSDPDSEVGRRLVHGSARRARSAGTGKSAYRSLGAGPQHPAARSGHRAAEEFEMDNFASDSSGTEHPEPPRHRQPRQPAPLHLSSRHSVTHLNENSYGTEGPFSPSDTENQPFHAEHGWAGRPSNQATSLSSEQRRARRNKGRISCAGWILGPIFLLIGIGLLVKGFDTSNYLWYVGTGVCGFFLLLSVAMAFYGKTA